MDKNQTFLGLDIGTRFVGVAVGQTITQTASPLYALLIKSGNLDWEGLDQLVQAWSPDAFVVGLPLKLEQKNSYIVSFIKNLATKIKERYALPIYYTDEDLTTVEAKSRLFSQKGYRGLTKKAVDCYAAKLILEDWLMQGPNV